jgi:hypothetical protein
MNACVCLVGWYFHQELLETLLSLPGIHLYIISHKPPKGVPEIILNSLTEDQIIFEKNLGYDWGAYQQFMNRNIWINYETIFFMHDDIKLVNPGVFQTCHEMLESQAGKCIVGNGRNSTKRDWPLTHIQCYAHSLWKPPSWHFEHDTVRGSFFALSKQGLDIIKKFEPLWDRRRFYGVGAGNFSLRASCGRIQQLLGENSFFFLSEAYRQSEYLIEFERGKESTARSHRSLGRRLRYSILVKFSRKLMTIYMDANPIQKRRLAEFMGLFFRYL